MADKSRLEAIISEVNKTYKKNIVIKGTELKRFEMIPFTSPKLNYLTRGGIAEGKMTMFVGKESGGKTTSALDIIKNYQKKYPDKYVVYLDAENTLDIEWGTTMGVNFERVILIKPEEEYGETLLDMVLTCIRTGDVGLVVIDSIPFIIPKAQFEEDLEKKAFGGNSMLIQQWCDKVIPLMNKYNCTMLIINQVRDIMGVTYTAYNYPGGRMLKHSCGMIFFFSKGSLLDENGKEVSNGYETPKGHIINVKVERNKFTKNDRRLSSYTLNYDFGIDVMTDTVDLAIKIGVIAQAGAWFNWEESGEAVKVQGKPKIVEYYIEHEELFEGFYNRVNAESIKE